MWTTFHEKGRLEGQRELIVIQLESRFGALSPAAMARVEQLTSDQLTDLARRFFTAQSLQELGLQD